MKLPRLIPWTIVALLIVLVALGFALSGCASFDYDWQRVHPAAPKPWRTVIVQDVDATCRALHSQGVGIERILGCATWAKDGCTIYLGPDSPQWVRLHEANPDDKVPSHCGGWVHP